ncbi:hypothetical protein OKW47_007978 [Paraburkholderia atlantica]
MTAAMAPALLELSAATVEPPVKAVIMIKVVEAATALWTGVLSFQASSARRRLPRVRRAHIPGSVFVVSPLIRS